MAVRFRRIEDRKQSVTQLRRRTANGSARRRLLPKLAILIVLAVVAGGLYLYFRPPLLIAPFEVRVEPLRVLSPVTGTVTWMIERDAAVLSAGDAIARVTPGPESGGSPGARREDLRMRLAAAVASLETERAEARTAEADLARTESGLRAALARLQESIGTAATDLRLAVSQAESLDADYGSAERLKRLGAITGSDYARTERAYTEARATQARSEAELQGLQAEHADAEEALRKFQTTRRAALASAKARVDGALASYEAVQASLDRADTSAPDDRGSFVLEAPTDARVLQLFVAAGTQVRQDDPVATLYRPEAKVVAVYVSAGDRKHVRIGSSVRLYPRGGDGPVTGRVSRVDDRVISLPAALAAALPHGETFCIVAEVGLPALAGAQLPPGLIGKAVIEKH